MKRAGFTGVLVGLLVCLTAVAAVAQTEKTTTLTGTVVEVDGGTLIVKMDNGEIRMFTPPADRVFVIDGKELKLSRAQAGDEVERDRQGDRPRPRPSKRSKPWRGRWRTRPVPR